MNRQIHKITLIGQYVGENKNGIVVGGHLFLPAGIPYQISVDPKTYHNLRDGVRNGWFKIFNDNYAYFKANRIDVTAIPDITDCTLPVPPGDKDEDLQAPTCPAKKPSPEDQKKKEQEEALKKSQASETEHVETRNEHTETQKGKK